MKVGCLNGKRVITSQGKFLGEVEDTEISVDGWSVTHLHVSLEKEISEALHFENPFLGSVKVLLPVATVDVVGDVIVLNKTIDELKEMKEFKPQK
ncbi:MAG: PRC-barrel domain-containing protein [Candidatus Bathyarchaeota archaeon]|nr:PRC-barrel domain-containing protein [Candidatus Bathyarchaeum tardum]WGM89146.1 MAG: PRC-barrel domain-containing protein [Candidatus Bathyarchaeum tardum]WNZ28616.1 MAG: PRC-barrel domain-containing protein [Candidatus Bathyarchaeota archaeon]